jgi:hypothetical protein
MQVAHLYGVAVQEFVQSQASFFDSYAQAGTLWAPTSDAFCYSALPQGGPAKRLAVACSYATADASDTISSLAL